MEFQWRQPPEEYKISENVIWMRAGKETNLFNGVSGAFKCGNFPYYFTEWEGDFRIRCKVSVEFQSVYDLGCIVIYENEDTWMKLAYENSDTGHPAIVSIVTRERSDDCNGERAEGDIWLQICRKGNMFSMHYSEDNQHWKLVRIFFLAMKPIVQVGVSVQCPTGESCLAEFRELEIGENPYEDIRNLR